MAKQAIHIILVPYHAGILNHRVGLGPKHLLSPVEKNLHARGFTSTVEEIPPVDSFEGDIGRSVELIRRVSEATERAFRKSLFPLLLQILRSCGLMRTMMLPHPARLAMAISMGWLYRC